VNEFIQQAAKHDKKKATTQRVPSFTPHEQQKRNNLEPEKDGTEGTTTSQRKEASKPNLNSL